MRFIVALAFLATCQTAFGCGMLAASVEHIDAFIGTIVTIENDLLAPLAPFGRKLRQTNSNPILEGLVVKGNAIGSIFYTPGNFFNPTLIGEAITGMPAGRKLSQFTKSPGPDGNPDPYGFVKGANLVASVLTGNIDHGRKLIEKTMPEETQWDVEAIHQALGFGDKSQSRKLQQDTVAANYLGSVVVDHVAVGNDLKDIVTGSGRKLLDYRVGYGFPQQTGSSVIQHNALASIAADPALLHDPVTVRKATLGFQAQQP